MKSTSWRQLENLIKICWKWRSDKKTGSLTVNFRSGGITNVSLNECLWVDKDERNVVKYLQPKSSTKPKQG